MADGFVKQGPSGWVAANRWHAALARAAATLQAMGAELDDLRVPVTWALAEAYAERPEEELVEMVAVLLPLTSLRPVYPSEVEDKASP